MAAIARVEDNVDVYDPEKYPWCWYGCSNGLKSKMNWNNEELVPICLMNI